MARMTLSRGINRYHTLVVALILCSGGALAQQVKSATIVGRLEELVQTHQSALLKALNEELISLQRSTAVGGRRQSSSELISLLHKYQAQWQPDVPSDLSRHAGIRALVERAESSVKGALQSLIQPYLTENVREVQRQSVATVTAGLQRLQKRFEAMKLPVAESEITELTQQAQLVLREAVLQAMVSLGSTASFSAGEATQAVGTATEKWKDDNERAKEEIFWSAHDSIVNTYKTGCLPRAVPGSGDREHIQGCWDRAEASWNAVVKAHPIMAAYTSNLLHDLESPRNSFLEKYNSGATYFLSAVDFCDKVQLAYTQQHGELPWEDSVVEGFIAKTDAVIDKFKGEPWLDITPTTHQQLARRMRRPVRELVRRNTRLSWEFCRDAAQSYQQQVEEGMALLPSLMRLWTGRQLVYVPGKCRGPGAKVVEVSNTVSRAEHMAAEAEESALFVARCLLAFTYCLSLVALYMVVYVVPISWPMATLFMVVSAFQAAVVRYAPTAPINLPMHAAFMAVTFVATARLNHRPRSYKQTTPPPSPKQLPTRSRSGSPLSHFLVGAMVPDSQQRHVD